jgi:hypothetical protein
MAEKHKSKYKAPKDFEKSLKTPTRKDLKDYTHDDKDGGMNPYSTKEMQDLVLRKVDKEVIDNIQNMVPEIKHRVYQDVKTGKYSQKEAKKIFKKLQLKDSESYLEPAQSIEEGIGMSMIKSQLSRLTTEQKELALRKYLRARIAESIKSSYLIEQPVPPAETTEPVPPAETTEPVPPAETTEPVGPAGPVVPAEPVAPAESPEEMSPEEKAKIEIEKQKQSKKDFYSALEALKSADTVIQYVEFGLEPLLKSMKHLSPEKFEMAKEAADSALKRVSPSTLKK